MSSKHMSRLYNISSSYTSLYWLLNKSQRLKPLSVRLSYSFTDLGTENMSVLAGLLKAGASFCQTARAFSTGACCQIRMHAIPELKKVDRWTEKRSMYGVYDNIGILGDFKAHPKDLIIAPCWVKAFRGNELQRLTRKKRMVGDRMMTEDKLHLEKRVRFLYRRYNRTGKYRQGLPSVTVCTRPCAEELLHCTAVSSCPTKRAAVLQSVQAAREGEEGGGEEGGGGGYRTIVTSPSVERQEERRIIAAHTQPKLPHFTQGARRKRERARIAPLHFLLARAASQSAPDAAAPGAPGPDGAPGGGPPAPPNTSSNRRLQQTQTQVDEVVDIMRVNVDKVLERDQKLSELDDRADALQAGASQFESCAAKLKNKYWWKNCKMMIMMGIIGVIVVGILFLYFFY
ncbi:hypothetical protein NQZ68_026107 [Dissostichus eleginoides]|nr:hypothetical protein NQZ68_026107 [Dissostichus eleginoides]